MSEAIKHTPGPWRPFEASARCPLPMGCPVEVGTVVGNGAKTGTICEMIQQGPATWANARLIAAAPDMLAALKAAQSILWMAEKYAEAGGSGGPEQRDYDEVAPLINKAIALAEGRSL